MRSQLAPAVAAAQLVTEALRSAAVLALLETEARVLALLETEALPRSVLAALEPRRRRCPA